MEDKEAFAMIAAHAVSGMPYDQLMPAGWRYTPSEQWGDQLLTQDPKTAELARQHGREVESLYTEAQLLAAVGKAGTMGVQLAHWKAFAIHAEGEHAAWKKTATEMDDEVRRLRIAIARAVPAMHSYASKNPKHEMNGALQDPCGVHAWLAEFGA